MTKWIRHRERIETVRYYLSFEFPNEPGAGYSFPCTEDGVLKEEEIPSTARESLAYCLDPKNKMIPKGVVKYYNVYHEPAQIACGGCGTTVTLDSSWANECPKCGALYNGFGQGLAPRSQWDPRGEY